MHNRKTLLMLLFAALAVAQLLLPIRMIMSKERLLSDGATYKFRTVPIDPYDPFVGRYITLNFALSSYEEEGRAEQFVSNEPVYLYLGVDSAGYATISSLRTTADGVGDYIRASVQYDYGNMLRLSFPFNRYYMTEDAAQAAEQAYNSLSGDGAHNVYALVSVMDGEGAIEGVYIDDVRLEDYLRTIPDFVPTDSMAMDTIP